LHGSKEKSTKVYYQENRGATQLVLLFLPSTWEIHIQTSTDNVSEMNGCAVVQLKNKNLLLNSGRA
jgi:hypothetical protein